ncbi:hypothetical protein [Rhizobium sp. Leaf321]|uniref:hypothetical protein n=1 Tax=Rhizobium sp. Leaf321 TaxID=1736335 RepID=UPI000A9ED580|nr:hypothetical protein [Rhizobium sp. Leaf321]
MLTAIDAIMAEVAAGWACVSYSLRTGVIFLQPGPSLAGFVPVYLNMHIESPGH